MSRPVRRWLGNLGLLLASVAAALILGELAARLVLPPQPLYRTPQTLYDPHPQLGWILRPGQDAFTHAAPVHVNSLGLRDDDEVPREKPPGERRVLVLGDSLTFGNGVATPETYAARLQAILREREPGVRVLNSGVPGWDVHQELDYLRERGLALQPDVVVVGFFANDVRPRLEDPAAAIGVDPRGRAELGGVRGLVPDELVYAVKRLRVVSAILYGSQELRYRLMPPRGDFWVAAIYENRESPASRAAWDSVRASLAELRDLCAAHGIPLVLAVLPLRAQVSPAPFTAGYQDRVLAIAAELGIRAIDVLPAFVARGAEEGLFIPFDGHPNERGHAVTAELLAGPVGEALARRRPAEADLAGAEGSR